MKICLNLDTVAKLLAESDTFQRLTDAKPFSLDFDIREDPHGNETHEGLEVFVETHAAKGGQEVAT